MPRTQFTPRIREAILKGIKTGNYVVTVCEAAGVREETYYRWLRHGKDAIAKEQEGYKLTAPEAAYAKFLCDVRQVEAKSEMEIVERIGRMSVDAGDWKGWLEILQRRHRGRWGRTSAADVTIETGGDPGESKGLEIKLAFTPPPVVDREQAA